MKSFIHTPIEKYKIKNDFVYVKREDLSIGENHEAPPFSKIRGLFQHLQHIKENNKNIKIIGYTDSAVSMAGWGISWVCFNLGFDCVIFKPQYKNKNAPYLLQLHEEKWKYFNADVMPIKASRFSILHNIGCKIMKEKYKEEGYMLPSGLPLEESIYSTMEETIYTLTKQLCNEHISSIVICVGSGTITSGILKALYELNYKVNVYGVLCSEFDPVKRKNTILSKVGLLPNLFLQNNISFNINVLSSGYKYLDKCIAFCPFPIHPYYDLKAWEWLCNNIDLIEKPVLFWNIGSALREIV